MNAKTKMKGYLVVTSCYSNIIIIIIIIQHSPFSDQPVSHRRYKRFSMPLLLVPSPSSRLF